MASTSRFQITRKDNHARVGLLKTRHGVIKTPFFMTVATKGVGKFLGSIDYVQMGQPALIANAFLLSLSPGSEHIKNSGGLHEFMKFPGVIFTDCGAFQMLREKFLLGTTPNGIKFKHPFENKIILLTPEKIMHIEEDIGADVAMMLDDLAPWGSTHEHFKKSIENTNRWAQECLVHHKDKDQLLFGIVQGGFFEDLRIQSAHDICSMDEAGKRFDGIAIGGVAIGEPKHKTDQVLDWTLPHIDPDRPRYVMGVGTPEQLVEYVGKGIDCFDSIFPTKNARHRELFTQDGPIVIDAGKWKSSSDPIDPTCSCIVCKTYSRAYLYYLTKLKDPTGMRLCSYHNVAWIAQLMRKMQDAIEKGVFDDFKATFLSRYAHR
jgi:queuine tRNA-ribosyltransferase